MTRQLALVTALALSIAACPSEEDPTPSSPCAEPGVCVLDYLAMLDHPGLPRDWVSGDRLVAALTEASTASSTTPASAEDLAQRVRDGLGLDDFLAARDGEDARIVELDRETTDTTLRQRFQVDDPLVGRFEVWSERPRSAGGPVPAIVGLHGHGHDGVTMLDDYRGRALAEEGYAVFAPTFRVNSHEHGGARVEIWQDTFTRLLLLRGYCMMTVRVYEVVRVLDMVRAAEGVDPARIGLMGHSGGSTVSRLVAAVDGGLGGAVYDHEASYYEISQERVMGDETCPALAPLADAINAPALARQPVLHVPYSFEAPEDLASIVAFFGEHLR